MTQSLSMFAHLNNLDHIYSFPYSFWKKGGKKNIV